MSHRTLYACLVLNLALIALYAWSATETTTIEIRGRGNLLVATVNGYELPVDDNGQGGNIGLYRASPQVERTYTEGGPHRDEFLGWVNAVTSMLREAPLGTAWSRFTLLDAKGKVARDEVFGDTKAAQWDGEDGNWHVDPLGNYQPSVAGITVLEVDPGRDFTVRAELRRGITPSGVMVRAEDAENGLLLLIRPEDRDLQWIRLRDGQLGEAVGTGFISKTTGSILQDVLRVLLSAQLVALALLIGFLLASRPIASLVIYCWQTLDRLIRRQRRPMSLRQAPDEEMLLYALDDTGEETQRSGQRSGRKEIVVAAAIGTLATVATAYIAYFVLEGIPHVQDDLTYLFQARVMAMGRLSVPSSPQADAFTQEFIVNHAGQAFGKYPPGHPLALLAGVVTGVPWLINPIEAGLTILVIFLIARKVYGGSTALLAALLAATSPFFLFMSGSMMAHPTELLFLSLFVLLYIATYEPGAGRRIPLLAGLALGFALMTRPWTAIAIATPFAAHGAYRIVRTSGKDIPRLVPVIAGVIPLVLALLAYNWVLTGSPLTNPMELWWPFDRVGFGPGIGISGAHTLASGLWNTYRNLTELTKHLFGWPANITLAFALLPFLTLRARRWDYLFLLAFLGLVLAQVAWWADGIMYGPRYYYESLAFLALLTARGLGILCDGVLSSAAPLAWLQFRKGPQPSTRSGQADRPLPVTSQKFSGLLAALLSLSLIAFNVAYYLPQQFADHRGYNYVSADSLRSVAEKQIHRAVIFVDTGQWFEWWNYGSVFSSNTPLLDGDIVYARDRGPMLNAAVIELYPGRSYYRLRGTTIEEIDK